jgi:hypothetical protein
MELLSALKQLNTSIRKYFVSSLVQPYFKTYNTIELESFVNSKGFTILSSSVSYIVTLPSAQDILQGLKTKPKTCDFVLTHLKNNSVPDIIPLEVEQEEEKQNE